MHSDSRGSSVAESDGSSPRCLVVDASPEIVSEIYGEISRLLPSALLLPPARGGQDAIRRVREDRPDLLFLDLEMPRMGGLTTLRAFSGVRPRRTVVLAPETRDGGRAMWEALGLGAVDYLLKHGGTERPSIGMTGVDLEERMRALLAPWTRPGTGRCVKLRTRPIAEGEMDALAALVVLVETRKLMQAARRLSRLCGELSMPILLDIPHPPRFTQAVAEGLDRMTPCPVRVAVSGERLAPGHVFLLPADRHAFLRGPRGEASLELAPPPDLSLGSIRHRRSIRALLDPEGSRGGIALTGLPSRFSFGPARQAAQRGNLFFLPLADREEDNLGLRVIERVGFADLRKVA